MPTQQARRARRRVPPVIGEGTHRVDRGLQERPTEVRARTLRPAAPDAELRPSVIPKDRFNHA